MLEVQNARASIADTPVLNDLSINVERGKILSVLGPSGAGKTSLLRAIAGLIPLESGRVSWDGEDITDVTPRQRNIGMVFQNFALFPNKDVRANIAFGLERRGKNAQAIKRRTDEMLELFEIGALAHRSITDLSGGEIQRVALARSLAPAPRVLLLDEPLGSLERGLRERLAIDLQSLLRTLGITAIHVTHDQSEAFTMGDQLAILMKGRVVRAGTPAEIWQDPRTPEVATFLAFPDPVTVVVSGGIAVSPFQNVALDLPDGAHAVLVPPRSLRIDETSAWRGTVLATQFQGEYVNVVVAAGNNRLAVHVDVQHTVGVGADVGLSVDPFSIAVLR